MATANTAKINDMEPGKYESTRSGARMYERGVFFSDGLFGWYTTVGDIYRDSVKRYRAIR